MERHAERLRALRDARAIACSARRRASRRCATQSVARARRGTRVRARVHWSVSTEKRARRAAATPRPRVALARRRRARRAARSRSRSRPSRVSTPTPVASPREHAGAARPRRRAAPAPLAGARQPARRPGDDRRRAPRRRVRAHARRRHRARDRRRPRRRPVRRRTARSRSARARRSSCAGSTPSTIELVVEGTVDVTVAPRAAGPALLRRRRRSHRRGARHAVPRHPRRQRRRTSRAAMAASRARRARRGRGRDRAQASTSRRPRRSTTHVAALSADELDAARRGDAARRCRCGPMPTRSCRASSPLEVATVGTRARPRRWRRARRRAAARSRDAGPPHRRDRRYARAASAARAGSMSPPAKPARLDVQPRPHRPAAPPRAASQLQRRHRPTRGSRSCTRAIAKAGLTVVRQHRDLGRRDRRGRLPQRHRYRPAVDDVELRARRARRRALPGRARGDVPRQARPLERESRDADARAAVLALVSAGGAVVAMRRCRRAAWTLDMRRSTERPPRRTSAPIARPPSARYSRPKPPSMWCPLDCAAVPASPRSRPRPGEHRRHEVRLARELDDDQQRPGAHGGTLVSPSIFWSSSWPESRGVRPRRPNSSTVSFASPVRVRLRLDPADADARGDRAGLGERGQGEHEGGERTRARGDACARTQHAACPRNAAKQRGASLGFLRPTRAGPRSFPRRASRAP